MSGLAAAGRGQLERQVLSLRDALRRLRAENKELYAENENLRAALHVEAPGLAPLGLSPQERTLLSLLMRFEVVTKGQALAAFELERPTSDGRGDAFPSVILCYLRRDLGPRGITIETLPSVGFRLTPGAKARIRELCRERRGDTA